MNDKSLDPDRISALEESLGWAQDRLRFYASYSEKPDSPFWNAWRDAQAILENLEPYETRAP